MGAEVSVRPARVEDKDRWNSFALSVGAPHHSYLFNWHAVIKSTFHQEPRYLIAENRNGEILGILPLVHFKSVLFGRSLVSVPFLNAGGVLAKSSDAVAPMRSHLLNLHRELHTSFIELRHIESVDWTGEGFSCSKHKVAYELRLTTANELFESFSKKLRAQIKRPQKSGYSVRFFSGTENSAQGVRDFYRVFSRNMRDLGTPVYPQNLFTTILREFGSLATIAVVYGPKGPAACGLLVGCGERVEILLASSIRDFNADAPNMLLYWEAMQWAYNNGYKIFDFGRSSPDSGPARFKEQWGATKKTLHWYYYPESKTGSAVESGDSGSFGLAVRAWRMLPLPIANALGPIISRHIP